MRRSAQVVAAVALLVVLAAVPALAAVCATSCVDAHPAAAAECHGSRGDSPRLEGAAVDPCATHDLASAEPATRTQVREEAVPAPALAGSQALDPLPRRRASAVTPGAPRPGPSRPPLVLRL